MQIVFFIIASILFGISFSLWYVSKKLKNSNTIGDYKGNEDTYSRCYTELAIKDRVPHNFDLHLYD